MSTTFSLSAADIFFSQTLLQDEWEKYTEGERRASISEAVKSIELNSGDPIATIESNLNIEAPYSFPNFVYKQAFYMLENASRYRNTSTALAIMHLSEETGGEKEYQPERPFTYLYPEALIEIGLLPQGVMTGRA